MSDERELDMEMDFDEESSLIELVDEEGNVVLFEHIVTLEHNDELYALIVPAAEIDDDEPSMVILKVIPGENDEDEDVFEGVSDEALMDEIYEKYLEIMQTEFEDEEEN